MTLADRLAARIHRHGPIGFDEFVDAALYDDDWGFYTSGLGRAGRRGDFITSAEVGPLFGAVMARALDAWWRELGEPDPFTVIEVGAGPGTLARSVLAAEPACAAALRYVLVDRSPAMRARHHEILALSPPQEAFADDEETGDEDDDEVPPVRGRGPIAVSLGELPRLKVTGVVLANELLDNLAFMLLEARDGVWHEVRVGNGLNPDFVEVLVPASMGLAAHLPAATALADGARIPVQAAAVQWLRDAFELLHRGRVVVVDYASTSVDMGARATAEWLRTYRNQQRGGHPLDDPGRQDITCEVAIDQLARVRPPALVETQAEFLQRHGIDELVEEGRRIWTERAALGDLAAFKARSRVREAEALTATDGLGAFTVAEWKI